MFVQGLEMLKQKTPDGKPILLMSTGWYGRSSMVLLTLDFDNCEVEIIQSKPLDDKLFGEGATVVGDKAY